MAQKAHLPYRLFHWAGMYDTQFCLIREKWTLKVYFACHNFNSKNIDLGFNHDTKKNKIAKRLSLKTFNTVFPSTGELIWSASCFFQLAERNKLNFFPCLLWTPSLSTRNRYFANSSAHRHSNLAVFLPGNSHKVMRWQLMLSRMF